MIDFEYSAPTRLDDAVRQLNEAGNDARILAGGTDIIVQLREGMRTAKLVVDVKKIPELMQLEYSPDDGLRLGASVPCWQIYRDSDVSSAYAALADAVHIIGGWQIQSRASVGGNLCNSSPAADSIPPLIVHDAVAVIAGPTGQRTVPVRDFCTGPGQNVLEKGELLAALQLPPNAARAGSAYERFIPRNEMDIAVAGVASWVQLNEDGDRIEKASIALGAVAPVPVAADDASAWLAGQAASEEVFAEAGERAKVAASPIDDMRGPADYRRHLVGVLTKRTLAAACERARR